MATTGNLPSGGVCSTERSASVPSKPKGSVDPAGNNQEGEGGAAATEEVVSAKRLLPHVPLNELLS